MIKIFKYSLFLVVLYIFIYNPPFVFLPKSPKTILGVLLIPLIFIGEFRIYLIKFRSIFLILSFIIFYSLVRDLKLGNFERFSANLTLYLDFFLLPISLLYLFYKCSLTKGLSKDIITVGVIATFFTIIAIVVPSIGEFFRYDLLQTNKFTEFVAFRTFGLSEGLTFTYGIIQGVLFCVMLFFSNKNKYILFLSPVVFIAILFNSRTGFTPVIIGVILYTLYCFTFKFYIKLILYSVLVIFLVSQININSDQSKTLEWGLDFFTQIGDVASGSSDSEYNTFDVLFGYMIVLPSTELEWLFGTGEYIFAGHNGNDSDVGYILQLYYGGIVYVLLLFNLILWMFNTMRRYKYQNRNAYLFSVVLIITIVIVNIKGDIFSANGYMRLSILFFMYFYCEYSKSTIRINIHK